MPLEMPQMTFNMEEEEEEGEMPPGLWSGVHKSVRGMVEKLRAGVCLLSSSHHGMSPFTASTPLKAAPHTATC